MAIVIAAITATAVAEMPSGFYSALNKMDNLNILCVKNYQGGAVFTEAYTNFEHLEKDTRIVTRSLRPQAGADENISILEASINSNLIGQARISWQSVDPKLNARGRHTMLAKNAEEMVGIFSIEKFVQLWSNSSLSGGTSDWIPCL